MKVYTQTYSLTTPSEGRFWTTQYSDIAVGLKVADALSATLTLKDSSGNTLTPEDNKVNGFTIWRMTTQGTGSETYTLSLNSSDIKFKLVRIVTDSTVFETDAVGEAGVTEQWVENYVSSETSAFVTDSAMNAAISTATSNKVTGTGVGQAPAILSATSVYAYAWATLSSTADENTMYVVLPDPAGLTRVKYTAASGLPDWVGDIVGELTDSSIPNISNVEVVEIGSRVTSIGDFAFNSCSSLTNVIIPESVTRIGEEAFWGCSSLTSVEFEGNAPAIGFNAFGNVASGCKAIITSTATGFPSAG